MTKGRVVLSGAFYGTNFGDHLFALLFAKKIGDTCVIRDASKEVVQSTGAPSVRPTAILSSKGMVMGPGGYFGEGPHEPRIKKLIRLRHHYLAAVLARLSSVPYVIVGVGVGPVKGRLSRALLKFAFNGARAVTVRDIESLKYLASYGIKGAERIRVGADAALEWRRLMGGGTVPHREVRSAKMGAGCSGLGSVFLHVEDNPSQKLLMTWRAVLDCVASGDRDLFVGTDSQGPALGTEDFLEECRSRLGDRLHIQAYWGPVRFIQDLDAHEVVVTHKLHVGVLGSELGKCVVSFPAHTKTPRFYRQIGDESRSLPLLEVTEETARSHFEHFSRSPALIDDPCRESAHIHYAIVDEFLQGL